MSRFTLTLLIIVGLSAPAGAEASDQKERLLFDVMFGGLHVADVVVSLDQSTTAYQSRLEMRTRGMLELFQDFRADMKSEGTIATEATPKLFSRAWSSPDVASDMVMTFDPVSGLSQSEERYFNPTTGAALKAEDMPWNTKRKPIMPVPENLRSGAIDPMTAFLAARRQIFVSGQREARVPVYDGRRRYDIVSTAGKPRTYTIKDQPRELIPIISRVEPVFGFDAEAEDRMRESKGTTLFTTDERAMPVQITLTNDIFSSVMNLVAECTTDPDPCDNFSKARE